MDKQIHIKGVVNDPKLNHMLDIQGVFFDENRLDEVLTKLYMNASTSTSQLTVMQQAIRDLSRALDNYNNQSASDTTLDNIRG